jgi:hypothetical protein
MTHANYRIIRDVAGEPLLIEDRGPWNEHPTVTNDAEWVVLKLVSEGKLPDGRGLLYVDSERVIDEIVIERGQLAGFRPGPLHQIVAGGAAR